MDLHPEELIEREASGELSPAERERLEAHLRQCPACRMEQRVRGDFLRVAEGAHADVRALIARALVPRQARPTRGRFRGTRLRFSLVAAALLLGLTGLAAAASRWSLWRVAPRDGGDPGAAVASTEASARLGRRSLDAPQPPAIAPAPAPAPAKRSRGPASRVAEGLAADAARLFDEANASRRRGDHEDAATAYGRLLAEHPESPEAHESLVVLGRMLLDDGEPARALPRFDEYVRRGGALTAEAMLGRALALGRLGRTEEERSAWSTLADAYPDGVHAERARARLAELGR